MFKRMVFIITLFSISLGYAQVSVDSHVKRIRGVADSLAQDIDLPKAKELYLRLIRLQGEDLYAQEAIIIIEKKLNSKVVRNDSLKAICVERRGQLIQQKRIESTYGYYR